MIPDIEILNTEITEAKYPTKTYKIVIREGELHNRISGNIDDLDSLIQTIYLILSTERYRYVIYSWDYGIELTDLIGKPMPYVMAELPRRVTEALIQDNRIDSVIDFEFIPNGKKLLVKFTVVSTVGNIPTELEVDV
jgi:hypothetical protein